MYDMIQIITDVVDDFVSNPFRPEENRMHHERILHYLHEDYFRKNLTDIDFKYIFRWEFPTQQRYVRIKEKLYVDNNGEPGLIDVVIKNLNQTETGCGVEYGLFTCDISDNKFRVKIENDILKLTDPVNNIKNKFLIYFFRCDDFVKADTINTIDRIDTVN